MKRSLALSFAVAAVSFGAFACSVLVDSNRSQCETDSDCTARGASFVGAVCRESHCVTGDITVVDAGTDTDAPVEKTGPWRCLGNVPAWTPESATESIIRTNPIVEYANNKPAAGVTVKTCALKDVECTSPLAFTTADDAGVARITAPKGFLGYFDIPSPRPELTETLMFWRPPAVGDYTVDDVGSIVSSSSLEILTISVGKTFLSERGHLVILAKDCDERAAAGVSLEITSPNSLDDQTFRFYVENQVPAPGRTFSDSSGQAGYANVVPGIVTLSTTLAATGEHIGTLTVFVRKGAVTSVRMPPTPTQ